MVNRKCPKCKIDLEPQNLIGVDFESCPKCSGVWLDKGELKAVTRSRKGLTLEVTVSAQGRTEYLCPCCHPPSLLFEGEHSLSGDFLLDICQSCGGLWFDRGEFPTLLQNRAQP